MSARRLLEWRFSAFTDSLRGNDDDSDDDAPPPGQGAF